MHDGCVLGTVVAKAVGPGVASRRRGEAGPDSRAPRAAGAGRPAVPGGGSQGLAAMVRDDLAAILGLLAAIGVAVLL